MRLSTALAAIGALASVANALPKITRTGKYLYDESGGRFYIRVSDRYAYSSFAKSSLTALIRLGNRVSTSRTTSGIIRDKR
jgi:hypothetical protein